MQRRRFAASLRARMGGTALDEEGDARVIIEYRLANGQPDKVPALAAELVSLRVKVLASGFQTAWAAKEATTSPDAIGSSQPHRCSSVPKPTRTCPAMPLLVPNIDRSASEV